MYDIDIWIIVRNSYGEYVLFSGNEYCEWIYYWFNSKINNLDNKLHYECEIKIKYNMINEFFHDCLEITLDPEGYIEKNPDRIVPKDKPVTTSLLTDIQRIASKIIKEVCNNRNDSLSTSDYFLGVDLG